MYFIMRSNNERDDHKLNFDLWSKLFNIRPYYKSTRRYRSCFGTRVTPPVTFNISSSKNLIRKNFKLYDSDKTFHEKIPNELKTSVEDPIKTVIKRNLDTVNENANIVRKRLNIFLLSNNIFGPRIAIWGQSWIWTKSSISTSGQSGQSDMKK